MHSRMIDGMPRADACYDGTSSYVGQRADEQRYQQHRSRQDRRQLGDAFPALQAVKQMIERGAMEEPAMR
jgi:hypothetical protein